MSCVPAYGVQAEWLNTLCIQAYTTADTEPLSLYCWPASLYRCINIAQSVQCRCYDRISNKSELDFWEGQKLLITATRPALVPTQHPTPSVAEALSPGIRRAGRISLLGSGYECMKPYLHLLIRLHYFCNPISLQPVPVHSANCGKCIPWNIEECSVALLCN
jgi:hypothetical protein